MISYVSFHYLGATMVSFLMLLTAGIVQVLKFYMLLLILIINIISTTFCHIIWFLMLLAKLEGWHCIHRFVVDWQLVLRGLDAFQTRLFLLMLFFNLQHYSSYIVSYSMWLETFKISKMFSLFTKGNEVKWEKHFYVIRDTEYAFFIFLMPFFHFY